MGDLRFLHKLVIFALSFSYLHAEPVTVQLRCPGMYCGRTIDPHGNVSSCGACPRGWRPDEWSRCQKCQSSPEFYDWLYLGFMAILSLTLNWFFIDITNKRKNGRLVILHISALLESCVAAVCTLLSCHPLGSLSIVSCRVTQLSDWYTMFFNPSPDYMNTVYCTQEAVYPLYTLVMIYYAFCLVLLILLRPILSAKFVYFRGTRSIYAALYFYPILILVQAVLSGLIYYAFPYMLLVISVLTNAMYLAHFNDQSAKHLLKENFKNPRNLVILIGHWVLHTYGIVSLTRMTNPALHAPLLCLVPIPALFYLLTVRFTDPEKLELS